mmetsp:Transcript_11897/g.36053  ORF Transcript_11897/g.36053 Transcript_11897/m.36053 type:complete len:511 (-) Transcript_11897:121-1653(-)
MPKKGKKGKGKKDKAPPKTPEELELERLKMLEEMRRRAIETKRALKRQLALEKKNSRVNRLKIQNQWRKIMRIAKVENLRKDIEILSQNHERDVDRKDAIIQMLDRDLEEAEDQFQMALRAHLKNVDDLIDLHDQRLLALEEEFDNELHTLTLEHSHERDIIDGAHTQDMQELNDIIEAIEAEEAEKDGESKHEHEMVREEIKNRNSDEIQLLRMTLDQRIEELEQFFENAHLNYLQNTDTRTTEFKQLTHRDQDLSREIDIKMRKIERLKNNVRHWNAKINRTIQESAERNKLLLDERNVIQRHFQKLKGRMSRFRDSQATRISELTENANQTMETLRGNRVLAEKILKLGEISRKLETEQEKVLPFFVTDHTDAIDKEADALMDYADEEGEVPAMSPFQAYALDANERPVKPWSYLDNFNRKFNKVALDTLAIQNERDRLEREYNDLQSILKQYLDGISVNEELMQNANALFVVNGRTNLNRALPVRRDQNLTVVDGNQEMAAMRMRA